MTLPTKVQSGRLSIGDKATYRFDAITIQDVVFSPGALTATYSAADRRYDFSGTGKYRGVKDVTIGGSPKNPRLVEERGVFKLTNFTPPKIDLSVGGVTFPTEGLSQASP